MTGLSEWPIRLVERQRKEAVRIDGIFTCHWRHAMRRFPECRVQRTGSAGFARSAVENRRYLAKLLFDRAVYIGIHVCTHGMLDTQAHKGI